MTWLDLIRDALTVVGTLVGTLLGIWLTNRAARQTRTEARQEATADALAELTECLDRHRAVMWRMVHRRLATAANLMPDDPSAAVDDTHASHVTRAAITRPLMLLCLRAPTLASHARHAARVTYAMHRATRLVDLERRRVAALRAVETLTDTAGRVLDMAVATDTTAGELNP